MKTIVSLVVLGAAFAVSGCDDKKDKTVDRGFASHPVSQLNAGIWVDPTGCDQWIIDDGVEGYLSARLDKYGKPVCSGIADPNYAVGDFKNTRADPI
jgi:hypothetical protein